MARPQDDHLWALAHAERAALAKDLAGLSAEQWRHGTLCGKWDVEQVVAHLTAAASLNQWQWLSSMLGARFRSDVHNQRRLAEHCGSTPAETLDQFRAVITSTTAPSKHTPAYLGEVVVHAQDIRQPMGLGQTPSVDALTPVADFFARRNFTVASRTYAADLQLRADDGPFVTGTGPLVTGSTLALVMSMAGRVPYLAELDGPGVPTLRSRLKAVLSMWDGGWRPSTDESGPVTWCWTWDAGRGRTCPPSPRRRAEAAAAAKFRSLTAEGLMYRCTVLEVTACVDESDELASLEVYNTVWPRDAVTIAAVHSYRDSAQDYIDCLAREDGVVLGSGVGAIFAYRPHRVDTLITVLAGKRRRGAGTALYEAISKWASERRAHELEVSVSGDDPESLSYAQRRGFTEVRRQVGLVLSLSGVSPLRVGPPAGVEIVTWAQRPELARGMYEVDLESHPDIPGFEDVVLEPFEDWMAHNMQRPTDSPEATFIALDGEEVIGFAKLSLTAPTAAGHAMTAVKRAWRGRGIAGALKAAEINWALDNGYTELHTSNEERNAPIQRLNAHLGYRPRVERIHLVGPSLADHLVGA